MADRATAEELDARQTRALELLTAGVDPASAVQQLAAEYGYSVRTAQRDVKAARREVVATVAEGADLVPSLAQVLANLQRIASHAVETGDLREANKALATSAVLIKAGLHYRRESDWQVLNYQVATAAGADAADAAGESARDPPF
jgi:hypothetical protein